MRQKCSACHKAVPIELLSSNNVCATCLGEEVTADIALEIKKDSSIEAEPGEEKLGEEEARNLIEEVRRMSATYWGEVRVKLLRLHEGGGHVALGYDTWKEMIREEFDDEHHQYSAQVSFGLIEKTLGLSIGTYSGFHLAPLRQPALATRKQCGMKGKLGSKFVENPEGIARLKQCWEIIKEFAKEEERELPSGDAIRKGVLIAYERGLIPSIKKPTMTHKDKDKKLKEYGERIEILLAENSKLKAENTALKAELRRIESSQNSLFAGKVLV